MNINPDTISNVMILENGKWIGPFSRAIILSPTEKEKEKKGQDALYNIYDNGKFISIKKKTEIYSIDNISLGGGKHKSYRNQRKSKKRKSIKNYRK
jgi:hypothetical protein